MRAAHRHLEACKRRETCTRPSGEVEGFGLRAGCALAHRMCRAWAPAHLSRPSEAHLPLQTKVAARLAGFVEHAECPLTGSKSTAPAQPMPAADVPNMSAVPAGRCTCRGAINAESFASTAPIGLAPRCQALSARSAEPRPKRRRRGGGPSRRRPAPRREKLREARSPSRFAFYFTAEASKEEREQRRNGRLTQPAPWAHLLMKSLVGSGLCGQMPQEARVSCTINLHDFQKISCFRCTVSARNVATRTQWVLRLDRMRMGRIPASRFIEF